MNQLPNAIEKAKQAIKANPGLIKDCPESVDILVLLMINYRTDMNYWGSYEHLKYISEDTRDKFIAASDAPTYEEMIEQHEDFKDDKPNSQVHPLFKDIINNSFKI